MLGGRIPRAIIDANIVTVIDSRGAIQRLGGTARVIARVAVGGTGARTTLVIQGVFPAAVPIERQVAVPAPGNGLVISVYVGPSGGASRPGLQGGSRIKATLALIRVGMGEAATGGSVASGAIGNATRLGDFTITPGDNFQHRLAVGGGVDGDGDDGCVLGHAVGQLVGEGVSDGQHRESLGSRHIGDEAVRGHGQAAMGASDHGIEGAWWHSGGGRQGAASRHPGDSQGGGIQAWVSTVVRVIVVAAAHAIRGSCAGASAKQHPVVGSITQAIVNQLIGSDGDGVIHRHRRLVG